MVKETKKGMRKDMQNVWRRRGMYGESERVMKKTREKEEGWGEISN